MFYREIADLAMRVFVSLNPFSLAEFFAIGRGNSPGMANLALRARTAHQGGS